MHKLFEEEGCEVFASIFDLHDIDPEIHKEGEFGIGIAKINMETREIVESDIFIHSTEKSREDCQKKIDRLRMEFQEELPSV